MLVDIPLAAVVIVLLSAKLTVPVGANHTSLVESPVETIVIVLPTTTVTEEANVVFTTVLVGAEYVPVQLQLGR